MTNAPDSKPMSRITLDQTHDGDQLTVTARFELTQEGTVRYRQLVNQLGPHAAAIKTAEGTLLLLPLRR
jgi:hypothetical protein